MNYGKIINFDSGNARGLSVVLFVSGCGHHCPKCHNKETWDYNYGQPFTKETEDTIIEMLKSKFIKNFVVSGGDPMALKNRDTVISFLGRVRKECPDKRIILYTGYEIDCNPLVFNVWELEGLVDYIIDGRYDDKLPTPVLDYRGSLNQQCYAFVDGKLLNISDEYFKVKG